MNTQKQRYKLWGSNFDAREGGLDEKLAKTDHLKDALLPLPIDRAEALRDLAPRLNPAFPKRSTRLEKLKAQVLETTSKHGPNNQGDENRSLGPTGVSFPAISLDELSSTGSEDSYQDEPQETELEQLLQDMKTCNDCLFDLASVLHCPTTDVSVEVEQQTEESSLASKFIRLTFKEPERGIDFGTYTKALWKIRHEDVSIVFKWLCYSVRPLQIIEMIHVFALRDVDSTNRKASHDLSQDLGSFFEICNPLLVVVSCKNDEDQPKKPKFSDTLELSNPFVKEFLMSDELRSGPLAQFHVEQLSANASIARTCLTCLLQSEETPSFTQKQTERSPLIEYAATSWAHHYEATIGFPEQDDLDKLAYKLVTTQALFQNWLKMYDPDSLDWDQENPLNQKNPWGQELYYMALLGVVGVVQMLLTSTTGADIDNSIGYHGNALQAASVSGSLPTIRLILRHGAHVNAQDKYGPSALYQASREGNTQAVKLLLKAGANVNARGGSYGTALHVVSENNDCETMHILLEFGIDVNAQPKDGTSALYQASRKGNTQAVKLLLEAGADVNARGGYHRTALNVAAWGGYADTVRILLDHGAMVDASDIDAGSASGTALRTTSKFGHHLTVPALEETRAAWNAQLGLEETALEVASRAGDEPVVRILLEHGLTQSDGRGVRTDKALEIAAGEGHESVVRVLLERVAVSDSTYALASGHALRSGHRSVVDLLHKHRPRQSTKRKAAGD